MSGCERRSQHKQGLASKVVGLVLMAALVACGGGGGGGGGGSEPATAPPSGSTPPPDTTPPSPPTITSPVVNPFTSPNNALTISGGCETGANVVLSGDDSATASCAGSTYTMTVSATADATYSYELHQTDASGNASTTVSFQWIRDSQGVPSVTIAAPATSPYYSSSGVLVISGGCVDGHEVILEGDDSQSMTCASSSYSFTIGKSADATYAFTLTQVDNSGNVSSAVGRQWVRDTSAPAPVTVTSPGASPHTSGDNVITLSGGCETGATVTISGELAASTACAGGSYSFSVSKDTDGAFDFSLLQTDQSGNASTAVPFQWVRDTSIPSTPSVSLPATNPYYSNGGSITISGGCNTGNAVTLSGDDFQTATCAANAFSFTISKGADATYSFSIHQTNAAEVDSSITSLSWVRDTTAPAAPVISVPPVNPYVSASSMTLSGSCETGATVELSGAQLQAVACASGGFSFTITETTDGTYDYQLRQVDRAGNPSSSVARQWVKDSTIPATPQILTPAVTPFVSNGSSLTLSGACETGLTVTLGGDLNAAEVTSPAGALTQTCSNSTFSFTISKTSDGTYGFTVKQTSLAAIDSGTVSQQWVRDATAPDTTITSGPAATNLATTASFVFGSTDPLATLQCSLDGAAFATCVSPVSYPLLSNGSHTFQVQALDAAGNADATPASHTWTQASGNTVALYHFDAAAPLADSSFYGENTLTDSGSTPVAGAFGEARGLLDSNSAFLSAAATASQGLSASQMTVEARVWFSALPSSGSRMVLASKMGTSGQYGWEFGLKRVGSKHYLYFIGSIDGTAAVEVKSTAITNADLTALQNGFVHLAVTWAAGSVKFYLGGAPFGVGTIGTAGSATLFASTAPLRLGMTESGSYLSGLLDEVRLSQIVRWTTTFVPPAAAYLAD